MYKRGSGRINSKRQKLLIIGIIFFVVMLVSGVYAVSMQSTTAVLNTGIVDIKLQIQKLNDEGIEVDYEDSDILYPGEITSFIPKVINEGSDCYLRVKFEYINKNIDITDYVTNFSNNLLKVGDYYYYDGIVKAGETIKLFDSVLVPDNIKDLTSDSQVKLNIIAEALQRKNVEPDYMSDDPWQGIEPTKNEFVNVSVDDGTTIIVKYNDNTENDISIPTDFWENMKDAMPGDEISDNVQINNGNDEKTKYYVEFAYDGENDIEEELLRQLDIEIKGPDGESRYSGKILTDEKILIGDVEPNKTENVEFKVSVPGNLSNKYSNIKTSKLLVIFTDDYKEKQATPGSSSNQESQVGGNGGGETLSTATQKQSRKTLFSMLLPRTGDKIDITITIFMISTIGLVVTMILDHRERKKDIDSE